MEPLFHGLFHCHTGVDGKSFIARTAQPPRAIPCPDTGRPLRVATLDAAAPAICPRCSGTGRGGFVSFVTDLRMAYACPCCRELVWLPAV